MKIINKVLIAIVAFGLIISQNVIFASMADYTDEQADNKQKQEQQEFKKEQEERIGKSSNNYLKSLSVKGFEIAPTFDKQTINYQIEKEVTEKNIEIIAETDDEKSSVSGTGKIELNSGENNLRIDVTAESGTVRTYFIKVICSSKDATEKKEEEQSEFYENRISQIQSEDADSKMNNPKKIAICSACVFIFLVLIVFIIKKSGAKKHGKNKRKH